MAIVLVATVGSPAANTYNLTSALDDYALATAWGTSWAALAQADKDALAVRSARALDRLPFLGYPTDTDQALQFPRLGTYHPDGCAWASDAIPAPIVAAHAHLACWLSSFAATADPFTVSGRAGVRVKTVDVLTTEYFHDTGTDGDVFLGSVIAPMLRPHGLLGAAGAVRLVR